MTSLKYIRFLKCTLETPYVVSYFFNGLLTFAAANSPNMLGLRSEAVGGSSLSVFVRHHERDCYDPEHQLSARFNHSDRSASSGIGRRLVWRSFPPTQGGAAYERYYGHRSISLRRDLGI